MEEGTKKLILKFTREVIENFVRNKKILIIPENYPEELNCKKGIFVTLNKKIQGQENLRGCIGVPYPTKTLIENLREAAISVTADPRFPPLQEEELSEITIEISLLSDPEKIEMKSSEDCLEKIEPHKDGLILKKYGRSGLFLPQVWETIPDKIEFLSQLCLKASLSPSEWLKGDFELFKFQVEIIRE